jgi:hypothetical protein
MRWGWLIGSVALIGAATLWPFSTSLSSPFAARWCVTCSDHWLADAISNVLLFLPLGLSLAGLGARARVVLLVGLGVSLAIELLQSMGVPPGRSPSPLDCLTNATGALLGAALFAARARVFSPAPSLATSLALASTLAAAAVVWVTSIGIAPLSGSTTQAFRLSPYEYSPGFGWYGGSPTVASVNGTRFEHRGTGPVVVEASAMPDTLQVALKVSGRDTARYRRSVFYLHEAGDSSWQVVIAQHGDDAELLVRRRASAWGLNVPHARIRAAFATSWSDPEPLQLVARSGRDSLTLEGRRGAWRGRRAVALSPLVGWSMVQSVVDPNTWGALVLQAVWLLALVLPVGWFCAHTRRPWAALGVAVAVVVGSLALAPALLGVATVGVADGAWLVAGLAGAFWAGRRRTRRGQAGILPS